jgi:hypothetical protein
VRTLLQRRDEHRVYLLRVKENEQFNGVGLIMNRAQKATLKVGDRVRVYGGVPGLSIEMEGPCEVVAVGPDGSPRVTGKTTHRGEVGTYEVHKQQCRKLIPRQTVEVLGFDNRDDGFYLKVDPAVRIYKGMRLRELPRN